jgi:type VI secretion system protein ImpF
MARKATHLTILPSLLDRLIDHEPTNRNEPASWRTQSLKEVKQAVRRDLEWLLNTRRTIFEPASSAKELWDSVYCYGLPDSTGLPVKSEQDRARLARAMEVAISTFEPRLINISVKILPVATTAQVVRFQIEAMLRTEPAPERVFFDSKLEITSGEFAVGEEDVHAG